MDIKRVAMLATLLVAGAFLTACGNSPSLGRFDVELSVEGWPSDVPLAPIEVDVVAVSAENLSKWESTAMGEYWRSAFRRDANKRTFRFAADDRGVKVLERSEDIWDAWANGSRLLVLADLPDAEPGRTAGESLAVLTLPREQKRWGGRRTIEIGLLPSQLQLKTPPLPESE
ncbi:MAG: hypothetical protein ACF8SC_01885 [Phycisphaerales bacterium JB037]